MKSGTHDGKYNLRFKVYDRRHTQTDVPANVTVTVKSIPHEAVLNSGSVRISGITDEDFIRIWNYRVSFLFLFFFFIIKLSFRYSIYYLLLLLLF